MESKREKSGRFAKAFFAVSLLLFAISLIYASGIPGKFTGNAVQSSPVCQIQNAINVNSLGHVGIGTTSLGNEIDDDVLGYGRDLVIDGGSATLGGLHIGMSTNTNGETAGAIVFFNRDNLDSGLLSSRIIANIEGVAVTSNDNKNHNSGGKLLFRTKSEAGSPEYRFVIDEKGNVGIGTLNPTSKLQVDGNLRVMQMNTGSNPGSPVCIDANGNLCACGSCA